MCTASASTYEMILGYGKCKYVMLYNLINISFFMLPVKNKMISFGCQSYVTQVSEEHRA